VLYPGIPRDFVRRFPPLHVPSAYFLGKKMTPERRSNTRLGNNHVELASHDIERFLTFHDEASREKAHQS
jgi:hypothetical protein